MRLFPLSFLLIPAIGATAFQSSHPSSPRSLSMPALQSILEQSQKSGKGVLVYFSGQSLGGVVVKLEDQTVELKNREYSRIVIRLDRIEAVAGN